MPVTIIYTIHAGDGYGPQNWWVLTNDMTMNIEELHAQFLDQYVAPPQLENWREQQYFHQTTAFVDWLIANHGFSAPETIDLFTEN